MPTATQANFAATSTWQDIAATLTAAASVDVLLKNVGPQPARVVFGGGSAPASDNTGVLLQPGDTTTGNAANIWVRSPGTSIAVTSGYAQTIGGAAAGSTDSGNPVKIGAVYTATQPTLADGQRGNAQMTARGELLVAISSAGSVTSTGANSADAVSGSGVGLNTRGFAYLFNGSTWDRAKKPASTSRLLSSAATTNATSVKTSAADLFRLRGYNASASARYLKLYNKASAPTVGTDTPVATYYLAPTAAFDIAFDTPLYFATGLAFAITGAAVDSDTTAIAAGDILCLNTHFA